MINKNINKYFGIQITSVSKSSLERNTKYKPAPLFAFCAWIIKKYIRNVATRGPVLDIILPLKLSQVKLDLCSKLFPFFLQWVSMIM